MRVKIQNVGVGNYIRNPKGVRLQDSDGRSFETLQVASNEGNSFLCYPVTNASTVPVTTDKTRYQFIPIDTMVEQVTI